MKISNKCLAHIHELTYSVLSTDQATSLRVATFGTRTAVHVFFLELVHSIRIGDAAASGWITVHLSEKDPVDSSQAQTLLDTRKWIQLQKASGSSLHEQKDLPNLSNSNHPRSLLTSKGKNVAMRYKCAFKDW
jgi:hypothetical protein